MSSLVVIGAQWGDEGKGKLVDYLTTNADVVVRFQGGNNAGHTLVVDGVTTKLHLVPSGILHEGTRCFIAAGVVLNPDVFAQELDGLEKAGINITPERIIIDRDTHLITPYHVALDEARERSRGADKIGTTGRGIGPAYEDRANRTGIRMAELLNMEELEQKILKNVEEKNRYLTGALGATEEVSADEVISFLKRAADRLIPHIGNVSLLIEQARKLEKRIIFEGAQGTLLDQMHGTLPYVTSSHTLSGAVFTGCGIGPRSLDSVLGVAKAYCTRVGEGPFPTELHDDTGEQLRTKGGEIGTTTGRPRRCGWFDAVAMKRAVRLNGFDSLAITKLDVLSGLEQIKVCINYRLDGSKVEDVPSLSSELAKVEPEYITFDGWEDDLTGIRKWHHLPAEARFYLATLAEIVACPISLVSVGPERSSTIFSSTASFVSNFMG